MSFCPICNSDTRLLYENKFYFDNNFKEGPFQIINICPRCGYVFVDNKPEQATLTEIYDAKSNYQFSTALKNTDAYNKNMLDSQRQYEYIINTLGGLSSVRSVLEIGAASGYNLSLYKKAGLEVFGVEPSEINVKSAKDEYGIDMYHGLIENYRPSRKFDMVIFSHVLEHLVDPVNMMKLCRDIASKYIFIEVPCFNSKGVDIPYGFFYSEHLSYFTQGSLENLMNVCGFKLVDFHIYNSQEYYTPAGSPSLLTLWKKDDIGQEEGQFNNDSNIITAYMLASKDNLAHIRDVIAQIPPNKKVAVYGANENTARLLANTDLISKDIKCFYDGDKNKQDHFINAIPVIPFSKQSVSERDIDCIIISAYVSRDKIRENIISAGVDCEIISIYD